MIEPLARFDETGNLVPWLAEEIPTVENGGVSEDLTSITWKIKPGLTWSDGTPFTSADVMFTGEYCMHPEGGCAQLAKFDGVDKVEAVDDLTVKVTFDEAKPFPYRPFVGGQSPIIQAAQFADCLGAKAPECTEANFGPIGTGPFVVDRVQAQRRDHAGGQPELPRPGEAGLRDADLQGRRRCGGGGPRGAGNRRIRLCLEPADAPDVLAEMAAAGKGTPSRPSARSVERIEVNLTDPSPDLPEGERSTASIRTRS